MNPDFTALTKSFFGGISQNRNRLTYFVLNKNFIIIVNRNKKNLFLAKIESMKKNKALLD